ncbi:MAG: NAD(P)-dependent glycerol-3-phosphate dehydrogenase [Armatimonadetes bacterium]|nr:NAD(P)-dependent glycerol-3-phosphate dehydrogenase [Armatimonadota bacterium]
MDVAVVGAGSWGTALVLVLARGGHAVTLYGRPSEAFDVLQACRENLQYLPGYVLPESVQFNPIPDTPVQADVAVVAVPSSAVREVLPALPTKTVVCIASKGLDAASGRVLSEVVAEGVPDAKVVALSGPNLAVELAQGVPTVAVAASPDAQAAEQIRALFMGPTYRVYVSDDMKGVELAGSLKNVMAIAAGMSDGLGYGDNTKGALMARGLSEIARLGVKLGAKTDTFLGIAGVGDLFATAASTLSRNYRVGYGLGKGERINDILKSLGQVAEGVSTAETALRIARQNGVQTPITQVVDDVIKAKLAAKAAVSLLMERAPAKEGGFAE